MTIAVIVSAIRFGLAHFGGGLTYVSAGVIAGLGYGLAYGRTRRIEAAMAVHFGVNAVHFLFFTYPRLAGIRRSGRPLRRHSTSGVHAVVHADRARRVRQIPDSRAAYSLA